MNREAFKLARDTLRKAVREYHWRRRYRVTGMDKPLSGYSYGPGKFQGEHWTIVHWYDAMLDGGGDEPLYQGDECIADLFEVKDVERAAFGLKETDQFAVLWHSSQGFETLEYVDANRYDQIRAEYSESEEQS